jgi:Holliday junction resolvasome RuvABC endonuclease subunit
VTEILFLDLGTKLGWARAAECDSKPSGHGVVNLTPGRFASAGMRFTKFRDFLDEQLSVAPLSRIVFEEVRRHRGTDAAHIYGGLLAILQTFCLDHGIEYEGLPVGVIKKHVTGKGNADKGLMIASVQKACYPLVRDDNEADAIGIGLTWLGTQQNAKLLARRTVNAAIAAPWGAEYAGLSCDETLDDLLD